MHLCSYGNEENGHIKGVEYIIELDKTEDVIAEILDLRKRIESAYGPADEIAGPRQIEEAQLVEAFETDEYWGSKMVWILSRDIPEEAREQFASTCWALHFSVMMPNELGDSETKGKVYIQLSFSLTMEPQGNVGG